jgi:hypothetical protein
MDIKYMNSIPPREPNEVQLDSVLSFELKRVCAFPKRGELNSRFNSPRRQHYSHLTFAIGLCTPQTE